MMRPKSALFYAEKIQDTAREFVAFIGKNLDEKRVNRSNLSLDLFTWALESITIIALDFKLGAFKEEVSEEVKTFVDLHLEMGEIFPKLTFGLPIFTWLPNPRMQPLYRRAEDCHNQLVDWCHQKVNEAKARIKAKGDSDNVEDVSILEKFIIKNGPDSPVTTIMAFDMMLAGIDTTGSTSSFLLYNLAK